jgi:redox-sensitive bicupin YhaK (pirin superfamily)
MLVHRPSAARGQADYGWLKTQHTFSFNTYHDPQWVNWSALRVINEDHIAPGEGFPTHPHRDMEIITYVVAGALAHRDSTGSESVMRPGIVQHMTAGSGIAHSEYNASDKEWTHLLQIWALPDEKGHHPHYTERDFGEVQTGDGLRLLASPDGQNGSLAVHQDLRMYDAQLADGESAALDLAAGRSAWVQLIHGKLDVLGQTLASGDGLGISEVESVKLVAVGEAHLLLFDLP